MRLARYGLSEEPFALTATDLTPSSSAGYYSHPLRYLLPFAASGPSMIATIVLYWWVEGGRHIAPVSPNPNDMQYIADNTGIIDPRLAENAMEQIRFDGRLRRVQEPRRMRHGASIVMETNSAT